ncbi:MAG: TRAP transporter large permease subunit [Hyphomicrobiaceae bacterium]
MFAWYTTLGIAFGLLVIMTFSGMPLFAGFLLLNIVGVVLFFGTSAFGMFTNSMFDTLTNEALVAVPLFLLMGEVLSKSNAIEELYSALDAIIGRIKIKLYASCIALATVLGTMSGSAMADAAILSRTLYPGMLARGYDRKISAGLIMSGATMAPIIPPSILCVVLATLASESVGALLVAGILPGILLASLLLIYVWLRVVFDPSKAPATDDGISYTLAQRMGAVLRLLPFCGVIFMVVGLIILGVASPTEAAATGVFAALLVSIYLRTFSLGLVWNCLFLAARTSTTIFVILMSANLFGQLLSYTGAPEGMLQLVEHLDLTPSMVFWVLIFISFISCMFLGQTEYMLISVPIFLPIVKAAGFDPIWFWMIYLVTITIGGMTPPFGMTMFVFKASTDMSMTEVYNATWPFVAMLMLGVSIMFLFPPIVTFLPSLM